jgi:hypothetical protein
MKEMAKKGAAIIWSASIFLTITDLERPAKKRTEQMKSMLEKRKK